MGGWAQRRTSAPAAPAWSKWMWVSSSAFGCSPARAARSVSSHDCGPGSTSTPSTSQQQMTCSWPMCLTSMGRTRCEDTRMEHRLEHPDRPWMMRTYAGHSTAVRSDVLYRRNLAKGQTGLSVAFDLPTQTGYDSDHELARGEVGKVGVPVAHRGDMAALLDGIPLDAMNTSMTINATAAWLLALYIVAAEGQGVGPQALQGTTQNDIIKEYLSRGTYASPPGPSMRLIADMVAYTVEHVPKWNTVNVCSYHLQEAGAPPA